MANLEQLTVSFLKRKNELLYDLYVDIHKELDNLTDEQKTDVSKVKPIWLRCEDLIYKVLDTLHQLLGTEVTSGDGKYNKMKIYQNMDDTLDKLYELEYELNDLLSKNYEVEDESEEDDDMSDVIEIDDSDAEETDEVDNE